MQMQKKKSSSNRRHTNEHLQAGFGARSFLCCRRRACTHRVLYSLHGLHPLDASSNPSPQCDMSLDIAKGHSGEGVNIPPRRELQPLGTGRGTTSDFILITAGGHVIIPNDSFEHLVKPKV